MNRLVMTKTELVRWVVATEELTQEDSEHTGPGDRHGLARPDDGRRIHVHVRVCSPPRRFEPDGQPADFAAGDPPGFIAVNSVFANLAATLAPLAGSLLLDWIDIRLVFFIAGGVHIAAALLFWTFGVADDQECA